MHRRWDKSKPPIGPFTLNWDCPQAAGLVAWYPMGNASGGNYVPDYASTYHLNLTAGDWTLGQNAEPVINFNGTSTFATSSFTQSLSCGLTARCRPNVLATQTVLALDSSPTVGMLILINDGGIRCQNGGQFALSPKTYVVGESLNLVGTWFDTQPRTIWVNGGNSATNGSIDSSPTYTGISVGRRGFSTPLFFSGLIGECAIYNRILTTEDAVRHNDPGLRFELWYPLRSKKWISIGGPPPSFKPWYASQRSRTIGAGAGLN
jgi:hypothetical protein